jgi:hypothetical protein
MYIPYQFLTAMEEDRLRRPARQSRRAVRGERRGLGAIAPQRVVRAYSSRSSRAAA